MTTSSNRSRTRVVVTRPSPRGEGLAKKLEDRGFQADLLALLEVTAPADSDPLRQAAREGSNYDSWIFTSAPAVDAFFAQRPSPPRHATVFFAVGEATASALASQGYAAITPNDQTAEGLVNLIGARLPGTARLLVPQAADARPTLVDGLSRLGFEVHGVATHDKVLPARAANIFAALFDRQAYGWVTFTSPRIVEHFVALAGDSWNRRRGELEAASIGPVTSEALRAVGVAPSVEALSPSDDRLVDAIAKAATP
ncbi:MAG: uroporphyrinogen-III synthase [Thermoanaerobaculia bacterium]|nr:uroporphyrinogen-III synthase [Thermoanaerobaculia bacterium]